MGAYLLRRLLLVVPTLLGIILINFAVVQFAPGGPVDQMIAELKGQGGSSLGRLSGEGQGETTRPPANQGGGNEASRYRGARGLDPAVVREIERAFGFDKPWPTRLGEMLAGYARFDLGRSLFQDRPVSQLISQALLTFVPGIRPWQVTLGVAAVALVMLACLFFGGAAGLVWGSVLFHVASVLDGEDALAQAA